MTLISRILDRPRTLTARQWLFQVHLWVGIFAGIYAILIGVSGSILVFREQIVGMRTRAYHHLAIVPEIARTTPDDWLAAVRKATGYKGQISIELPSEPAQAVEFTYFTANSGHAVFVNPYTSQVLANVTTGGPVIRWIDTLHSNFFLNRTGRLINGIGALLLLSLAITGMIIWWPGRRLWRRRLLIDFRARWKRVNWDIHHATGFWGLAGFSILCITGAWFTWPQFYRDTVTRFYPVTVQASSKVQRPPGAQRMLLAELIRAADEATPGKPVWRIFLPAAPTEAVRINKLGEGDPPYRTATTILVDPYTGSIVRIDSPASKTTGDKILSWIGPLHTGNFGGLAIRILYAVLGLTMPTLFISGFIMWWQRVIRPKLRTVPPDVKKDAAMAVS